MSVDKILELGSDALASAFQIVFPTGIPGSTNSDAIALRMDQSFDPPEENVATYDIKYRGMTITKTSRTEGTAKEFTVEFRIDQDWNVVKDFRYLYEMTYNPINGTALGDSFTRFPISVQALDSQMAVVETISFKNCKLKSFKVNSFGNEDEGPLRCSASFIYGTMTYE